ncbi:peroxisomal coenzyme A diphosphatase NUDT7 [Clupea harengus]|uniref:Peroxisomal coenzyme A diphosphatase NUDT7 n=1 Tax=Clupea harengus TaxID=7950 RepID=A0A6P3VX70_CLUHA|nr:peroxisomal coenzyme A diphosphatase NUDT7 [Clupea harengus]XP_012683588.2 peroxisomal coenzyme A diphosphatase NUDT7 [Clupea harengus]
MEMRETAKIALKKYDTGDLFSFLPAMPKASVLIPVFVRGGELHVLMTLRSPHLNSNAGEVCFPGGKSDPEDKDEVDTALREAKEEIGLPPEQVEVVCKLFPIINKRGLLVTPVVAFIDESFVAQPNPAEVSEVFTVPLDFFRLEAAHSLYPVQGMTAPLHSFLYPDPTSGKQQQIWGLTAMIAIIVSVLATQKKPEFNVGFNLDNPLPFFQHNIDNCISKL